MLIFSFISRIPIEHQGINLEPFKIKFSFYIVNNEISQNNLQKYIFEANEIWNKYNISILTKKINHIKINITTRERNLLYTNISEKNNLKENNKICDEFYMPLINKITKDRPDMSIIFINGKGASGRGHLCNHSFIIFKEEKNYLMDLTGLNLAHEIGHILGLRDSRELNEMNLMNDKYKNFYIISKKPTFLNQEQIRNIVEKIKN